MQRNPIFDGRYIYVIDSKCIRAGDVMLTRAGSESPRSNRKSSRLISKITGGTYSHALLCTVPPTLIEALPGHGVCNLSVLNCFAFDIGNVRVLRYQNEDVASSAATYAMRRIGQPYSFLKAIASSRRNSPIDIKDPGIICSALVAASFMEADAEPFASLDLGRCTPATLEKLDCFQDITSEVFRRVLAPANAEAMTAFDGERMDRPSLKQSEVFRRYFDDISPQLDFIISQLKDVQRPVSFFDILRFINRFLEVAEQTHSDIETHPVLSAIHRMDLRLEVLIKTGELSGIAQELHEIDSDSLQSIIFESFQNKPDFDLDRLASLLQNTRDTIAERRASLDGDVFSVALASWKEIEAKQLGFYQRREAVLIEVLGRMRANHSAR